MSASLIDILAESIKEALGGNEWIGRRGERLTEKELKWLKLFNKNGITLKNIYIPKDNGETSEIDLVYITEKGIFVIESKNYSGWIFGDEKSYYWTAMLPNKEKSKFYNPILQNRTHIKWLKNFLNEDIPMYSLIVFSERCELKKIPEKTDAIRVIKRDYLVSNVRSIWNSATVNITAEKINEISERLKPLTNAEEALKKAHIDNINRKFGLSSEKNNINSEEKTNKITHTDTSIKPMNKNEERLCPKCGNKLVLRVAGKGINAGNEFYGCSSFPKCRYTENKENG